METEGPTFKRMIRHNYSCLLRCVDPSEELLRELQSVLSVRNRLSVINQQETVDDRTNALLTALLQTPDNLQKSVKDSFVAALRNSGQDHVANIFHRESDKVPMSVEHRQMLVKHKCQLCQYLDPENGLLDWLISFGVISSIDSERILSKMSFDAMAREFIDTILKKSDDAFQSLIQALNETGQSHVTFILTGEGNSRPLSDALIKELISNRFRMVNAMEAEHSSLVSTLNTKGVFSKYDALRVTTKYHEGATIVNETILDLIMRKSQSSLYSFIEALNGTGHEHVAAMLQTDVKPNISSLCKPETGLFTFD